MPQSYRKQSKRLLTYLTENEHLKIDDKKNEVIIHDKSCSLIDFVSNLIAYRKWSKSFDSHLYKCLKSSNF